jgi:hypothetical protein
MSLYYVCRTPGCSRNRPRLRVMATTVQQQGHALCVVCGMEMYRQRTPLKGRNTKVLGRRSYRVLSDSRSLGKRKTGKRKTTTRKRLYKR